MYILCDCVEKNIWIYDIFVNIWRMINSTFYATLYTFYYMIYL